MTREKAIAIAKIKIPKKAKLNSVTDHKGYYIFGFDDPDADFHDYLAIHKVTGALKLYSPWADKDASFFKALEEQNK